MDEIMKTEEKSATIERSDNIKILKYSEELTYKYLNKEGES